MLSGTRTEPLTVDDTRVADAICFDVAYDDGIHAQLRNGADLLVVQTSNATFIKTDQIEQQFEITRLRAIETGRYVAVASTNGVSGIIAPDGTVVDRAEPRTTAVLVDEVGLTDQLTPAVRHRPVVRTRLRGGDGGGPAAGPGRVSSSPWRASLTGVPRTAAWGGS